MIANKFFLYPANFWQHKNHHTLLTAFVAARKAGLPNDIKLVCTGAPGEGMNAVIAAAQSMGLGGVASFPGFVDDCEFVALMKSALGVVFPSLYEGFGMPIIEAMAVGCPVACSNCTSLPEVAGDAAILFDPHEPGEIAEAICRLESDQELRSMLVARGKKRANEFADAEQMT